MSWVNTMCEVKDAQRYEQLAKLQESQHNTVEAHVSYLEAASIYVLQASLQKNNKLVAKANTCYRKAQQVVGKISSRQLSIHELAQRVLKELHTKNERDMLSTLYKVI